MAENHSVRVGEPPLHPAQPPLCRPGIVDHADPRSVAFPADLLGQTVMHLRGIDVPRNGEQRRPDGNKGIQRRRVDDVACVQDQVAFARDRCAPLRNRPPAAQVRVRDDREAGQTVASCGSGRRSLAVAGLSGAIRAPVTSFGVTLSGWWHAAIRPRP